MKKIKILTSLVGLTGLSMGLVPAIASCSNSELQIELVSKQKEREFNNETGGSSFLFKLSDIDSINNIKVKLINLKIDDATTESVSGLVKTVHDSAGNIKVVINTNTLLTQWPNATKFEFSLQFTNKTNKQSIVFDGFSLTADKTESKTVLSIVPFEECLWSVITERVAMVYSNQITEEEFYLSFTKADDNGDQIPLTSMDDLIGLERRLEINTVDHIIRVIGINHDVISEGEEREGEKALLTFESFNFLSDSDGINFACQWTNDAKNYDFVNSVFRNNLNSSSTVTWYKESRTSTDVNTSAINMICNSTNDDTKALGASIQTTKHYVATSAQGTWPTYNSSSVYNDKLFVLNYYNYNATLNANCKEKQEENPTYKFYKIAQDTSEEAFKEAKKKQDVSGQVWFYPIASPHSGEPNYVWDIIGGTGETKMTTLDGYFRLSFAFSI